MQMYMGNTLIFFTPVKNAKEAAKTITSTKTHIQDHIMSVTEHQNMLFMMFLKHQQNISSSNLLIGEELQAVNEFKYQAVILDSAVIFKSHISVKHRKI